MKKYLLLITVIILPLIGFGQQKNTDKDKQLITTVSTDMNVQMNLRTDLEIYKGKIETVSSHISDLQDRQDKRIDSIETFIYWVLGLISALFVLLGIFLALFTYKTNKDYRKAEKELKEALHTIKEAKKLQYEAKDRFETTIKEVQEETTKNAKAVKEAIGYEIKQGKNKIEDLINEAQNKIDTIVQNATKAVIQEIDKRNKVDALLRKCSNLLERKNTIDASNVISDILQLDSQNAQAYFMQALLYSKKYGNGINKDLSVALENIDKAIEFKPNDDRFYRIRGYIFAGLHESTKALADIKKAQELNPKDNGITFEKVELCILTRHIEEAKQILTSIDCNNLSTHDKLNLHFLELVVKTLEGTLSNSDIDGFIKEYKDAKISFSWDLTDIQEYLNEKENIFSLDEKKRLREICDQIQTLVNERKKAEDKIFIINKENYEY